MTINRFYYVGGNDQNAAIDFAGPFETKEEASAYAKAQFEAVLEQECINVDEIAYDAEGNVSYESTYVFYSKYGDAWSFSNENLAYYGDVHVSEICLTGAEMEEAMRLREYQYRLEDAARQFVSEYLGVVKDAGVGSAAETDNNIVTQRFLDRYGFGWDEAINNSSEHFLLDQVVSEFERINDCNVTENDLWLEAIRNTLDAISGQ